MSLDLAVENGIMPRKMRARKFGKTPAEADGDCLEKNLRLPRPL
jgi:hypothetical protein